MNERSSHGSVEKGVFTVNLFAAAPARVPIEIRLRAPEHKDLPVVLRGLGNEASLIAFHSGSLAHQGGIPGGPHAGRLRKLGSRNGLAPETGLALHHSVNAFGTADVRNAETRNTGEGTEAGDLFLR